MQKREIIMPSLEKKLNYLNFYLLLPWSFVIVWDLRKAKNKIRNKLGNKKQKGD